MEQTEGSLEDAIHDSVPEHSSSARKSTRPDRSSACQLCHRRKIKCDKKQPCSNCARQGLLCCYPGPDPPPRRPHKTTISDVAERLAQLERTVRAISSTESRASSLNEHITSPASTPFETQSLEGTRAPSTGVLVQDGDSSRYFNEELLSRVLEEEEEMQSMLASYPNQPVSQAQLAPLTIGGLVSNHGPLVSQYHNLHPSKWQAVQLWQAYVDNVDPLAKILHIPTTQVTLFTAINNTSEASDGVKALLFAVYFAATTSLPGDQAANLLDCDKNTALSTFQQGFDHALTRANLLEKPTLTLLQALAIYLLSVRAHNAGRSVWILNGLAIRLAQSIGLHRDGTKLKLSPFDSELRRRLWWHLWVKDARASEDHGIMVGNVDAAADVNLPLNIDDSGIDPSMTALPAAKSQWSEMTFSLIVMDTNRALQRLYCITKPPGSSPHSLDAKHEEIIASVSDRINQYLSHCNLNIPIQRAAFHYAGIILRKLRFVSHQHRLERPHSPDVEDTHLDSARLNRLQASDEELTNACEVLEQTMQIQSDDLLFGFRWSFETYPQYHVLLFVLWHLCARPQGSSAARAWAVVDSAFDHEKTLGRDVIAGPGSKWKLLKSMKDKAARVRMTVNQIPKNTDSIETNNTLAELGTVSGMLGEPNNSTNLPFDYGADWGFNSTALPNWGTLVEDFQLQQDW